MKKEILVIQLIILGLSLVILGCAGEPQTELNAAKDALKKAREAEADRYTADLFTEAENSVTEAENLIAQKNYGEAKDLLKKAKTIAESAASQAPTNKEHAEVDAKEAISESKKVMEQLEDTQKKAQQWKVSKAKTDLSELMPAWQEQLRKAEEEYGNGNFDLAKTAAVEVFQQVSSKNQELVNLIMAKQK